MVTDWSEEAKARRSASAKKAAETRRLNQVKKAPQAFAYPAEKLTKAQKALLPVPYPYFQNSRVARWALSGVAAGAITPRMPALRWTRIYNIPFYSNIDFRTLRG